MEIKKRLFGQTKTGEAVFAFTLKNSVGTEATILTYGAANSQEQMWCWVMTPCRIMKPRINLWVQ